MLKRCLCSSSNGAPLDPYKALGVAKNASADEIKKSYFRLAKVRCHVRKGAVPRAMPPVPVCLLCGAQANHPDLNKSPDAVRRFREVAEAYDTLRDPAKRRAYDAYAAASSSSSGSRFGANRRGAQQQQQQYQQYQQRQQQQWRGNPNDMFRQVWSELGMVEIDTYIERVKYELGAALAQASRGNTDGT